MIRRLATLFLFFVASFCNAATWSAPSESIAHYEVSYGRTSGEYPNKVITQATEHTCSGLAAGKWFFVVTAISTSGERGRPSPEVSYVFPEPDTQPMIPVHVYQVDLITRQRTLIATIYVARKERDFFQLGIEIP